MLRRPVVGVLLTAGHGSRFDVTGVANKLLAPLLDGTPMAVQATRHLMQVLSDVVAVVLATTMHDAQVDQLTTLLAEAGCEILCCPSVVCGMSASLAAGITARPQAGGWIITLTDMPWIAPKTITQVANAVGPHGHIALFHVGQRDHPTGFGADFLAGLTMLDGDGGARRLIDSAKLISIGTDDAGTPRDVDTLADLAR